MATKNKDTLRPAVPQEPTKRDRVIAQRQKQIAAGDTLDSIANQSNIPVEDLLSANPGVVTVRPGQVLSIPKPTGGGYMPSLVPQQNNPFAGSQAMVGVGTVGGGQPNLGNYTTSYNGFQTPTTNGFQATPAPRPSAQTATPGYTDLTPSQSQNIPKPKATIGGDKQSALGTPAGYTNLTPSQSQNIPPSGYTNLTPSQAAPVTQSQAQQATPNVAPPRPTGVYTGDPNDPNTAAWKARWEWEARNPAESQSQAAQAGLTSAPRVMTRDEIWNMKAAQRRRQMVDQPNNYNGSFQYNTSAPSPLVRNITWGIRG